MQTFPGNSTLHDAAISKQLDEFTCDDKDLIPYEVQEGVTTFGEEYMVVVVLFRGTDSVAAVAGLYLDEFHKLAVLQTLCVGCGGMRKGVGRLFMTYIFKYVRDNNIEQLQIGTVTSAGAAFYPRVGFQVPQEETEEFRFVIGKEAMESHYKQ